MNQKEFIGLDSIGECKGILKNLLAKRILLVRGKSSFKQSGAEENLQDVLREYEVLSFSEFECNPKIEDVRLGIETFRDSKYDAVLAVGGGSVIDMAKLVNFFIANEIDPSEFIKTDIKMVKKGKPVIAIPTTAGSGSEATHFAVLYINGKKYSVAHEYILPDYAIVDCKLTYSLPAEITAITGMDAFSQAVESYWSSNSTEESKRYAKESIELILSNLLVAVNGPTKPAREAMSKAAHLSGKAINITKTSAPHAISYPLTAYFNIPHGYAVSLTLSELLVYNYGVTDEDVLDSRGSRYTRETINEIIHLLGAEDIISAKEKIDVLRKGIGLKTKLRDFGIKYPEDIDRIVEKGLDSDRVKNNPRMLTSSALRKILCDIY